MLNSVKSLTAHICMLLYKGYKLNLRCLNTSVIFSDSWMLVWKFMSIYQCLTDPLRQVMAERKILLSQNDCMDYRSNVIKEVSKSLQQRSFNSNKISLMPLRQARSGW